MKKILATAILLSISGGASALGLGNDNSGSSTNFNTNTNTPTAIAAPVQGQAQGQGQLQGQMQGQASFNANANVNRNANANLNTSRSSSLGVGISGASASNVGNTQQVTVTDSGQMRYSGSYEVKSTGIAPDVLSNPTAPCRIAVGLSGGWIGGALGFGGSVEDEGCRRRETARVLAGLGRQDAAVAMMCFDSEAASVLPECAKPAASPAPVAVTRSAPAVAYRNPATVKELNGFNH